MPGPTDEAEGPANATSSDGSLTTWHGGPPLRRVVPAEPARRHHGCVMILRGPLATGLLESSLFRGWAAQGGTARPKQAMTPVTRFAYAPKKAAPSVSGTSGWIRHHQDGRTPQTPGRPGPSSHSLVISLREAGWPPPPSRMPGQDRPGTPTTKHKTPRATAAGLNKR